MNGTNIISLLVGIGGAAVGLHFGRRFGRFGRAASAVAGLTAAHWAASRLTPASLPNGREVAGGGGDGASA